MNVPMVTRNRKRCCTCNVEIIYLTRMVFVSPLSAEAGVRIASISPGADGMQSVRPDISIRPREN